MTNKQNQQKEEVKEKVVQKTEVRDGYEPTEMVIREIMVQKNVNREEAIRVLKNPAV